MIGAVPRGSGVRALLRKSTRKNLPRIAPEVGITLDQRRQTRNLSLSRMRSWYTWQFLCQVFFLSDEKQNIRLNVNRIPEWYVKNKAPKDRLLPFENQNH